MASIVGTSGNDNLVGTSVSDHLQGLGGRDNLDGRDGVDVLEGGSGDDNYFVDPGDTIIEAAGGGLDIAYARGNYTLGSGVHVEALYAIDYRLITSIVLTGNEFNNSIGGDNGNNRLYGGGGADTLRGYGGVDTLDGGAGADLLIGGAGDDRYYVDSFDRIVELAGEGLDIVYALTSFTLSAGAAVEALASVDYRDTIAMTLRGNEFNNSISGNNGANSLYGGGGADTLRAYDGNDNLDGGAGADLLIGGLGNDNYFVDGLDRITELAGEGFDTAYASESFALTAGASIEMLSAVDARATTAMTLRGNELDNTVNGNAGNNSLYGGAGIDTLRGFDGHDNLYGEAGADTLIGGFGDDNYFVDGGDRIIELAGEGSDTAYASESYTLAAGVSVETLASVDYRSTAPMTLRGNELDNVISGNNGANSLFGGAGMDTLRGYDGDDILDGGADADRLIGGLGNDIYYIDGGDTIFENAGEGTDTVFVTGSFTLAAGLSIEALGAANASLTTAMTLTGNELANTITGNAGANVLNGGLGADVLTGLGGADTFDFTAALGGGNVDRITDFEIGTDLIRLAGAAGQPFAALASGQLAAHAFVANAAGTASTAAQMLIYNSSTGALLYDVDGAGGAAAVQFATLQAGLALSASDFFVAGPANSAPVITSGTSASIAENSATSTIVYQAAATDANGDRISYSLSGADAALFSIDQSGAVRFLQSPDFEARSSYSIAVEVRDSASVALRGVTVGVTDVPEGQPPAASTPVINETSAANDGIGAAQVIDRAQLAVFSNPNLQDPSLPSVQINGAVSVPGDKDFFSITLQAGELLILDVDGTATGGPQALSLDAFLTVFGPNGLQLASNDDLVSFDPGSSAHSGASHNMDSLIRFRASTAGTYTFSIGSFVDPDTNQPTSSGSYILNVSIGPPATAEQINQENVQALISGSEWSGSSVSYGFTTSPTQYGAGEGDPEKTNNFEALNGTQQAVTRVAFGMVSQYTALTFSEMTAAPGSAQIRLAQSDDPETAHAYYPGGGDGGDVWFRNSAPESGGSPRYDNPVPGNYGYLTFLHEIGHALGLKHGHEAPALSPERDSMEYSIMTYRGYIGASDEGGYRNESWGFAQSFMMYDIAALQQMYGVNWNTNSGDTRYSWSATTGAFSINGMVQWTPGGNRVFQTIWDGGGTDTYDLSNYTNAVTIDLRPGEWTTTSQVQLANLGDGNYARGNVANALQVNGDPRSLIENAIGGSGNDTLIANEAANRLTGGSGVDTFAWKSIEDAADTTGPDRILDFLSGSGEKIDLSAIDAILGTSANDAFTFIGANSFTGTAGELRFLVDGSGVNLYGDINGDAVADLHIIVNGTSIVAADFIF